MSASDRPRPPLRVLVVGPGVSDGRRRAWAYIARPLAALGHQVFLSDSLSSPSAEAVDTAFEWNVHTNRPHVVVQVADGVRAHHDGVAALTASGRAATIAVHHPFALDTAGSRTALLAEGAHHVVVDAGGGDPLLTDPTAFAPCSAVPTVDVACFGPRSTVAEEWVLALADAGLTLRLVDATWDGHPLLRGLAYGRPPFPYLTHRLGVGRTVLVLPSAGEGPGDTELRVLEASCAGRPLVGPMGDAGDVVASVERAIDADPARPPDQGWTDVWPDILERALGVCGPDPGERRFWSFGVVGAGRPRVSVLTSVYRGADYLVDAVDSLREQTIPDIEVLLLDDGSDDETTSMIEALAAEDPRVRGFRQDNIGQHGRFDLLAHQLISEARAPVIAHLGGDDIAHPERLARQLAVLDERPEIHIVCSNCVEIDSSGRVTGSIVQADWLDKWSMLRNQMVGNHLSHPTVTLRRDALSLVGPYSRGFACDYDYWTKAAGWLGFHRIVDPLVAYRVHARGSSTVGEAVTRASREFEWIRAAMRRESTLLDLYPELERLEPTTENVGRTAAHFAAMLLAAPLRSSGTMALAETELARRYVDDPAIVYNGLYASLAAGSPPIDVIAQLDALVIQGVTAARPLLERLGGRADVPIGAIPADDVFPGILGVRPGPEDDMWYISDRSRTARLVWADVDWRDVAAIGRLLDAWCRSFGAGTAARLVLDQRGIDAHDAVIAVQKAAADLDVDVSVAADIELSVDRALRTRADVVIDARRDAAHVDRQLGVVRRRLLFG